MEGKTTLHVCNHPQEMDWKKSVFSTLSMQDRGSGRIITAELQCEDVTL